MNIIKRIRQTILPTHEKESIIKRLLDMGTISNSEAIILLRNENVINITIEKLELSSGAKILFNSDDNETNIT